MTWLVVAFDKQTSRLLPFGFHRDHRCSKCGHRLQRCVEFGLIKLWIVPVTHPCHSAPNIRIWEAHCHLRSCCSTKLALRQCFGSSVVSRAADAPQERPDFCPAHGPNKESSLPVALWQECGHCETVEVEESRWVRWAEQKAQGNVGSGRAGKFFHSQKNMYFLTFCKWIPFFSYIFNWC